MKKYLYVLVVAVIVGGAAFALGRVTADKPAQPSPQPSLQDVGSLVGYWLAAEPTELSGCIEVRGSQGAFEAGSDGLPCWPVSQTDEGLVLQEGAASTATTQTPRMELRPDGEQMVLIDMDFDTRTERSHTAYRRATQEAFAEAVDRSRDADMQTALDDLADGIVLWASANGGKVPNAAQVAPHSSWAEWFAQQGAAMWPYDPYSGTGELLSPGSGQGHYVYRPIGSSFVLSGVLSDGSKYVIRRSS